MSLHIHSPNVKGTTVYIKLEKAFSTLTKQLLSTCGIEAGVQVFISNETESAKVAQECLTKLLGDKVASNLHICHRNSGAPYFKLANVEGNLEQVGYLHIAQQLMSSITKSNGHTATLTLLPQNRVRLLGVGIDMVAINEVMGFASISLKRLNQYFSSDEVEFLQSQNPNRLDEAIARLIAAKEAAFKSMGDILAEPSIVQGMMLYPKSFMDIKIVNFDLTCCHAECREKILKQQNLYTELCMPYELVFQVKREGSFLLAVAFCLSV